jgi:hypothetical protein
VDGDRTVTALTARDVLAMLDRHYYPDGRQPAGILAKEIESPNGRRRADAIWLPTTATRGTSQMVGHEVKVSRADVLVELSDPTKCDPWMRYCHRWWLTVSDPALVEGLDIPDLWGVMAPPSGRRTRSMTIVKTAPELHPHEPALGVQRVTAWYFHRARQEITNAEQNADYHRREADRLRRDVQELRAHGLRGNDPEAARIAAILDAIHAAEYPIDEHGARIRVDDLYLKVKDSDIALVLLNYERAKLAIQRTRGTVESTLRGLTQVTSENWTFREARKALKAMQASLIETEASLTPEQLSAPPVRETAS